MPETGGDHNNEQLKHSLNKNELRSPLPLRDIDHPQKERIDLTKNQVKTVGSSNSDDYGQNVVFVQIRETGTISLIFYGIDPFFLWIVGV